MQAFDVILQIENWEEVEIGHKAYETRSIEYTPFKYRSILTNDRDMSDLEVILFYNARGNSERLFDEVNNDFFWKKLPFSFLNQNTVHLLITAICHNLYHFLLAQISKKVAFVKPNFRLKRFIFRFITVPAKWIERSLQWYLKLFTSKVYHPLLE